MLRARVLVVGLSLLVAGLACGPQTTPAPIGPEATSTVAEPLEATITSEPTATSFPPLPPRLWMTFMGSGSEAKWLEGTTATNVTLPISVGQFYDFAPSTGKILYASHFASV
ncbi:MAG TPA: hypothetical protein VFI11_05915, partial [Anaerolineales bacterium]|nr:hypothetical protein [Anaerolineales bacterium]